MGIGDTPMDFVEAPMAFGEPPTSFGKAPMAFGESAPATKWRRNEDAYAASCPELTWPAARA